MNDTDGFLTIALILLALVGGFFWGKSVGSHQKPCNQYTQWQYSQGLEPAKCLIKVGVLNG